MDRSEAFLLQARSDFQLFELLWELGFGKYAECHALQHLQMTTEKLAKSILSTTRPDEELMTHVAFRQIYPIIVRPDVALKLGYTEDARAYRSLLDRRRGWFRDIEQLSPSVGTGTEDERNIGQNVEYPWVARNNQSELDWHVPAHHAFVVSRNMRSPDGPPFLDIIRRLLERLPGAISS